MELQPQSQDYPQDNVETTETVVEETPVTETIEEVPETEGLIQESEFNFTSLEDINLDSIPSDARTYVEPILQHVQTMQNDLIAEKQAYEEVREHFDSMLQSLDAAAKGDIEPLVEEYESVHTAFTQVSTENVDLAHRLFQLEYPEYEQQSDSVKRAFAEALVHQSFNDRYVGDNLYDKMVDAYKLTMYRMGKTIQPASKSVPSKPVEQQVSRQPNPQAVKQSLVSGGALAPNLPSLNLEEMSYEDILARGEHLLDL